MPEPQNNIKYPLTSLSLANASDLVLKNKQKFQSASLIAAQRPIPKQEISEFEYGITSDDQQGEINSIAQFEPLPTGLSYFHHSHTDLVEASIDLFGAISVLYWNSRFSYPNGLILTEPSQVRLTNGRLFSVDSPFTLEMTRAEGSVLSEECKPIDNLAASVVHHKLTGRVIVFHCTASFADDARSKLWYFVDYARYVNYEIRIDNELQSAIRVKNVKFR